MFKKRDYSFSRVITNNISRIFIIYSILLIFVVYFVSYRIINSYVNENLNDFYNTKVNIYNSIYSSLSREVSDYLSKVNKEPQYIDYIYSIDEKNYLYYNPVTIAENSFPIKENLVSQKFVVFPNNNTYLSYWKYYSSQKVFYGISLDKITKMLNTPNFKGKYIVVLKANNTYFFPENIIFKEKLANFLKENYTKITLDEFEELKISSDNYYIKKYTLQSMDLFIMVNINIMDSYKTQLLTVSAFFILFFIVVFLIMNVYIREMIKRPINQIIKGINSLKSKNATEIKYNRNDEFGIISNEFNALYLKLQTTIEELRESESTAKHSSDFKSKILKMISHEVRTPLHSIIGFSEHLKLIITDPKQGELLDIIKTNSKDLLKKFERLMERANLEDYQNSNKMLYDDTDILKTCFEVAFKYEGVANAKKLNFKFDIVTKPEFDLVFIDTRKLKRILEEILDNACKFTDNGEICFTIDKTDKNAVFIIKDTGKGIKDSEIEMVCENFYQTESYLNRTSEGLGIGLSIAKKYIDQFEGILDISNKDIGTEVIITIPKDINLSKIRSYDLTKDLANAREKFKNELSDEELKNTIKDIQKNIEISLNTILNKKYKKTEDFISDLKKVKQISSKGNLSSLEKIFEGLIYITQSIPPNKIKDYLNHILRHFHYVSFE